MTKQATSQLDKVLALADSSFDGEALMAVRKARQMLSRDGLNFSDLARAAQSPRAAALPMGLLSGSHVKVLENAVIELRDEVERLRSEKARSEMQMSVLKQRVQDMEARLGSSHVDADRWRQLARETADKLWDLGQSMERDEPDGAAPLPRTKP